MIVHQRPRFWQLFSLMRLSVLPRIGWQLFAATLLSVVVIVVEKRSPHPLPGWGVAPFTLLGVALSIFLGFRNNACYDRCAAEQRLGEFGAVQAACERIRGTLTPFPYTLLIHRTSYAYCFLLPFGLASTMSWGMPVFCALVAYTFFGLDAIGDDLEEPFGSSLNALPLNAMARTVEISLLEAIGAENIPSPLQPVRSVLQ